jgi:hypothetical protein
MKFKGNSKSPNPRGEVGTIVGWQSSIASCRKSEDQSIGGLANCGYKPEINY